MDLRALIEGALTDTGLNLVASCSRELYDGKAPAAFSMAAIRREALGLLVVASGGPDLFRAFERDRRSERNKTSHPFDDYVGALLERADLALRNAHIRFSRVDARFDAQPQLDFRAIGEAVDLGRLGPFGMLIHPEYGPWWGLRAAYFVDAPAPDPAPVHSPCEGCSAPCVGTNTRSRNLVDATIDSRKACIVGQKFRYDDRQLAFHYAAIQSLKSPS